MKLTRIVIALAAVTLPLAAASKAAATDEPPDVCYEQVEVHEAQYVKHTSPDEAGPFDKIYSSTWWKGQVNGWHTDVGEIAEGPGPHPDGFYVYKRIGQRTTVIDGDEIPCETTPPDSTTPETSVTVCSPGGGVDCEPAETFPRESPPLTINSPATVVTTIPSYVPQPTPVCTGNNATPITVNGEPCLPRPDFCIMPAVGETPAYTIPLGEYVVGPNQPGQSFWVTSNRCGPPAPETTVAAPALPATGVDNSQLALIAGLIALTGGGAVLLARRPK